MKHVLLEECKNYWREFFSYLSETHGEPCGNALGMKLYIRNRHMVIPIIVHPWQLHFLFVLVCMRAIRPGKLLWRIFLCNLFLLFF